MALRHGTPSAPQSPDCAPSIAPFPTARASVAARLQAGQIALLDASTFGAFANIPALAITAYRMRRSVPAAELYFWVGAMAVVVVAFMVCAHGPLPWPAARRHIAASPRLRLALQVGFAAAVGGIWGVGGLVFGARLDPQQLMFLSFITMSAVSVCVVGLGSYLPAFFAYLLPAILPLIFVSFMRQEQPVFEIGLLLVLYVPTIAVIVRAYNRSVVGALKLRAENEALAENLATAEAAAAAAVRSKWDTLAHLSHELRTPMNAVLGFSDVMQAELFGPLGARYLGYAGNIHTSGRHALDLIDAILEASRAEAGDIVLADSEIEPSQVIEECLRMVEGAARAKNLTLRTQADPAAPRLVADRQKLRQVLLNLLTNAIKYTPEGGSVSVTAASVADGFDIKVADTGIGIAADDLQRCLQPFVRLSDPLTAGVEGAGLGLTIARRLTEAHGGALRLASVPGQGTTATIHLPRQRCRAASVGRQGALRPAAAAAREDRLAVPGSG